MTSGSYSYTIDPTTTGGAISSNTLNVRSQRNLLSSKKVNDYLEGLLLLSFMYDHEN